MIYLYNRLVNADTLEIEYLGMEYKLSGKNHMGDVDYYSYTRPGQEPVLVTPAFAEQFLAAAKKLKSLRNVTTPVLFRQPPEEEVYDYGDSKIYHYALNYKNIRITMQLENKKFHLEPSFTIVSGTVLGKYISVDVSETPELAAYCE